MDPDWLPFHPNPAKPRFQPPAGAVDAHCHVFGPADEFPFAPERKYTPCDAGKDLLWSLRDHLGFSRNVIVQATCHATDNRALVDALLASDGRARGVASLSPQVRPREVSAMHEAGVRGARFNFLRRLVDRSPRDDLLRVVEKIAPFDWHVVIYFEAEDLDDVVELGFEIPLTLVVDHMGRPDVSKQVEGPEFLQFLDFMHQRPNTWAKVSCLERLSLMGPPGYADAIPFARCLVERFPDRVLWGTDWPHPNMKSHMPDDGKLVDLIPSFAVTEEARHALLVDNPMRLYWPGA